MTESTVSDLAPGTGVAHYRVESVLGRGGMGTVYLAHDEALDRPVALKVLRPEVAHDPSIVDRFVREARAAARVSHPNLTHVYFVGKKDDRPFFAMEYCPGTSLEARVREGGPFDLGPGIEVLVQAARGLAAAHAAGVVHRDVKPSNLMVLPDGTVKVADFGLAKSLRGDVEATGGGRVMGTPTYISPEQCRGKEVDARTDVYLLGLTGWFLFAGRPAYGSDQIAEVIDAQLNHPLPDLTDARPDLPPALQAVLERMCAKDPERRPAAMEDVVAALEGVRPRPIHPAPVTARALAFGIDGGVFVVAGSALTGGLYFLDQYLFAGGIPAYLEKVSAAAALVGTQLLLEMKTGTTVGKYALDLRVARADGAPAGAAQFAARFLVRFPGIAFWVVPGSNFVLGSTIVVLQGAAFAAGFLWYFFSHGRTLSDVLTRTRVVYRFARGAAGR